MINYIKTFPHIVRMYSLPISIFSWFAAFCYGISCFGNIKYGLIALLGICFVHMGTNAFDDYLDYKNLKKETDTEKIINAQRDKCSYVFDKKITPKQVLMTSFVCLMIAAFVGLFFVIKTGITVILFMLITAILAMLYPIAGYYGLCEVIIFLIYGPLLFGGMCYIMTGNYNPETLVACLPTVLMTLNILYTDTLMDYHFDKNEGKKTLANRFTSQLDALSIQKDLIVIAYLSLIAVYELKTGSFKIFLTLLTIPMAKRLIDSLREFITNNQVNEDYAFMKRMCLARNLMVCFSLIFGLSLLWK